MCETNEQNLIILYILFGILFASIFCNGADCAFCCFFEFVLNLVIIEHQSKKKYSETAPSNGANWDDFSEQY